MRTQRDRDEDLALGRELERKDAAINRLREALTTIADIGEASGSVYSLRNVARLAREALSLDQPKSKT